jgi:hypothetical protein
VRLVKGTSRPCTGTGADREGGEVPVLDTTLSRRGRVLGRRTAGHKRWSGGNSILTLNKATGKMAGGDMREGDIAL